MNRLFVFALLFAAALSGHAGGVDETRATLREHVLKLINRDRARYDLPPVALDLHASAIGDAYCRLQIRNRTTGHFTLDGLPPYARYSFAGGNDAVRQNAAAWSADYAFSERALLEMIGRSQDAMMAEMPPHDGHRRTLLDPHATHVGIGLAWQGGEFRMVQEMVRRYLEWSRPLPREARLHQSVIVDGRPLHGTRVEAITVHHEPFPRTLTAQAASAIATYALPAARREYVPRSQGNGALSLARRSTFRVREDGTFAFTVPFPDGPGLYTVVVWVRGEGHSEPFAASNVSIRVEGELQNAGQASRGEAVPALE